MKRGKHLCVHICVCAQLPVFLLLLNASVDVSRWFETLFWCLQLRAVLFVQSQLKKKSKSAGLTRKKAQKNTWEFSSGKCFFITVLDECHRLQVRCWEITETLLFYYHFLHLQVKLWRWCIGIITRPLCQRKWSFCLLCRTCTGQTYMLTHISNKSFLSSLLQKVKLTVYWLFTCKTYSNHSSHSDSTR